MNKIVEKENAVLQSPIPLRPASSDEAGLFYSQLEAQDEPPSCVGHLRMDFGYKGQEFWTTWWPHNGDVLNTPEFKAQFEPFVNELRKTGPLHDLSTMERYCNAQGVTLEGSSGRAFGFVAESEHYRYCLRCTPVPGDYQGYLYVYDKRQQELAVTEQSPEQGQQIGGM